MNQIIPIFYDQSSYKSILTFDEEKDLVEGGYDSIITLCKEAKLHKCHFVSNSFYTFLQAKKNLKKNNIQLIFGLEIWLCEDTNVRDEASIKTEHKVIIFSNNADGYKDLIKISTAMNTDINNKYYHFRFDIAKLRSLWTNNLTLTLPFFDSFLARNLLTLDSHINPDFPAEPIIFREIDSGLPFEFLINEVLDNYNKESKFVEQPVKTVFYRKPEDSEAWIVYRSIDLGSSYHKPKMNFACSDRFNFESYKELSK